MLWAARRLPFLCRRSALGECPGPNPGWRPPGGAQLMAMLPSAMLHWGESLGGLVLLLVILYDVFQSVVLPRPAINKLATVRYLVRGMYWIWRGAGNRMESIPRRERWLATYGPVAVLVIFVAWGLALVLGYGMIIDGVRDQIRPAPGNFGT